MKFIIQLFLMLILALCGTSLYANDGAAPPGSPAGAPAEPVIQPTKPTSPSAPTDSKELPAKATRRKKEVEDADYKAEAPDEPDAWEPLTRGTQVLQIPRVGCIVRCAGHGMILVPFTKVETDDAGGRRLVNTH